MNEIEGTNHDQNIILPSWEMLDDVLLSHFVYFAINLEERKYYATHGGRVTMSIGQFLNSVVGVVHESSALTICQANWLAFIMKKDTKTKSQMVSKQIVIGNNGKSGFNKE